MNDLKRDMMRIQELIGNAFRQTGSLVALTDGGQMNPNKLQKTLEQTMEQFEAATLELRKLCERYAPGSGGFAKKPILPSMDVTGSVEAFGYGWLHNRAQASRRQASRSQRRFFAAREDLHAVGSRITCRMLAVGPRRCLVDCYGYDLDMTQREIRYAAIPDLRTEFHPGSEIDCIVKEYHPRTGELSVSAKETEVNPFFGAEERHPVGSRRFAMISGKYGGGVFCNLPDGVTCMCNYSYQHEDADFMVGEHVMLMVQRYDQEKLQMYGKIMSKW